MTALPTPLPGAVNSDTTVSSSGHSGGCSAVGTKWPANSSVNGSECTLSKPAPFSLVSAHATARL